MRGTMQASCRFRIAKSAFLPGSMEPMSFAAPSDRAPLRVAASSRSCGAGFTPPP